MRYLDRREFLYDPAVFRQSDVTTALKINSEYTRRVSPRPYTRFFEVNRETATLDPLWHTPIAGTIQYSRTLDMPTIVRKEKLDWMLVRTGRVPSQRIRFYCSNLILQEFDYFPLAGDFVYHAGYRLEICNIELEPDSYWQQTNVWLGLTAVAQIVPDGDRMPILDPSVPTPGVDMLGVAQTLPVGPGNRPSQQTALPDEVKFQ